MALNKLLGAAVKMRIAVEEKICDEVAKALIGAGYIIRVCDGEELVTQRTTDPSVIKAAMFSTDEDYFFVYRPHQKVRIGWIHFVYGNEGYDVVSDYTVNLEPVIKPITDKYA